MNQEQVLNIGLAGVSCATAGLCVHPFETAMVFQQLSKTGEVRAFPVVMKNIVLTEGFTGWYRGITASLARELIYSSLRLGLYEPFRELFESRVNKESDIQRIASRMAAGATAAGLAATIAHPTDLFKVRAQGYQGKPPPLYKLIKQVGGTPIKWGNYYEGIGTSVVRAMRKGLIGITYVAVYNEVKDFLKKTPTHSEKSLKTSDIQNCLPFLHSWKDSDFDKYHHIARPSESERLGLIFATAIITGLAITCSSSPFTNARTVIMTNPGKFTGLLPALGHIWKTNGPLGFFRGFSAQWARLGPYALIQFCCWEQLRYYAGLKPI